MTLFHLLLNYNLSRCFCLTRNPQNSQKVLASLVLTIRDILYSSSESGEVLPKAGKGYVIQRILYEFSV